MIAQFRIRWIRLVALLALVFLGAYAFRSQIFALFFRPGEPPQGTGGLRLADLSEEDIRVVATGLDTPWEIAFLPEGGMLVTERPGNLVEIRDGEQRRVEIPSVYEAGESGLMGLALHPDFAENRLLYVYYTTRQDGRTVNVVERYRFAGGQLSDRTLILGDIPGARFHDGGRIAFGPDGMLYITTGDAGDGSLSQLTSSLAGKILRLTAGGGVPPDNPFGNAVYSLGHRNPQGLTWDDRGRLWSTEHGPSGAQSGLDELNLIERGGNYGWPTIRGDERREGMISPVAHSGPSYTWAPAGAAYWNGSVFFGGLRGEALYEARVDSYAPGSRVEVKVHFRGELGRIRAVRLGPDGLLYIGTSNRDGRGRPRSDDDRILALRPGVFRR
ncbi:MAG: glucose sorbosone dehydrogenase [Gemmatimonadales bacterium]|nr:MAG: glucose sorbosone dehydrogenase [Gemmatimonadales bacterium]